MTDGLPSALMMLKAHPTCIRTMRRRASLMCRFAHVLISPRRHAACSRTCLCSAAGMPQHHSAGSTIHWQTCTAHAAAASSLRQGTGCGVDSACWRQTWGHTRSHWRPACSALTCMHAHEHAQQTVCGQLCSAACRQCTSCSSNRVCTNVLYACHVR